MAFKATWRAQRSVIDTNLASRSARWSYVSYGSRCTQLFSPQVNATSMYDVGDYKRLCASDVDSSHVLLKAD